MNEQERAIALQVLHMAKEAIEAYGSDGFQHLFPGVNFELDADSGLCPGACQAVAQIMAVIDKMSATL